MQHIIKKQIIELSLNKKADAFRIQQTVSGHYRQDIVPLMENIFNELSHQGETIHIDQLEIDLGILSEKEINQAHWNDTTLAKIREQLIRQIGKQEKGKILTREADTFTICRQWFFYMQKGYLPWNVLQINAAWYDKVLETLAVDFVSVSQLRKIILDNPVVAHRITLQHNEAFLVKLAEILTAEDQKNLPEAIKRFDRLKKGLAEIRIKIWEQILLLAAGTEMNLVTKRLIERIETKEAGISIEDNKTAIIESVDEEAVFVQNAGMVLIHPFLPSLFKKLKLVKEGKFENTAAQQKALYLLHFIATGITSAEEYELTVPKILCNWPLAMPVEKDIEVNKDELSEAENMLRAAIEQWEVLKNTSPDGLREGFLQRRGKCFSRNDKRYLQVEGGSLDVLLDQLPWNLNMIKLPWMKEILWVEWR